jgi:hypothetical protein
MFWSFDPIQDYHGIGEKKPALDQQQNLDGIKLERNDKDNETHIQFSRKLVTGDPHNGEDTDISIDVSTRKLCTYCVLHYY